MTTNTATVDEIRSRIAVLDARLAEQQQRVRACLDAIEGAASLRARVGGQSDLDEAREDLHETETELRFLQDELVAAREAERDRLHQQYATKIPVALREHLKDVLRARKSAQALQAVQFEEHQQVGTFLQPVWFGPLTLAFDGWLKTVRDEGYGDLLDAAAKE
jgi:hypothetical protein